MAPSRFSLLIDQQSLNSHLNMGFQVVIPNPTPGANGSGIDPIPWLAAYLPLAQPNREPRELGRVRCANQHQEPETIWYRGPARRRS